MKGFYVIEIQFKFIQDFEKGLIALKFFENLVTQSKVFGKGIEHDSIHYLEHIYFKWQKGNTKIKLYIDDYNAHSLCFDIFANTQATCIYYSKILEDLIKLNVNDINVVKNWVN
ncbi:MAG TPA: hypothetical protein ENK94_04465 [Campylobacterales bacterium]|nr:hypothetical protein [Campylobacterales bacterium]